MGRAPCCDKANVKRGPWSPEEDAQLKEYIEKHGTGGNWIALPHKAGLRRCGKSCRLRWLNYLRPNIKHGEFTDDEDRIICTLFARIGSRWSVIAGQLQGRTDNDIKNYWNTKLKKKLLGMPHKSPLQLTNHQLPCNNNNNNNNNNNSNSNNNNNNNSSSRLSISFPYPQISSPFELPENNIISSNSTAPPLVQYNRLLLSEEEASCSRNYQNSHGKRMEHDHVFSRTDEILGNYLSNDENHKFLITSNDGYENALDYSIEDIKQMISTNHMCNNLNFFVDEIKTEERTLY